jgi:hypothetical protein
MKIPAPLRRLKGHWLFADIRWGWPAFFSEMATTRRGKALRRRIGHLDDDDPLVADAYQVIGALAHYANVSDHPEVVRALDYFAYEDCRSEPILPWPREPLPAHGEAFHDLFVAHDKAIDAAVKATAETARLRAACAKEDDGIQQALGKALRYPWYKDDQVNFPGATEVNGVFVGEHVAATLADEAAAKIVEMRARIVGLEAELIGVRAAAANNNAAREALAETKRTLRTKADAVVRAAEQVLKTEAGILEQKWNSLRAAVKAYRETKE